MAHIPKAFAVNNKMDGSLSKKFKAMGRYFITVSIFKISNVTNAANTATV
jgi:hypothetical protein